MLKDFVSNQQKPNDFPFSSVPQVPTCLQRAASGVGNSKEQSREIPVLKRPYCSGVGKDPVAPKVAALLMEGDSVGVFGTHSSAESISCRAASSAVKASFNSCNPN